MASIRKRSANDGGGYQVRYYGPDGRLRSQTFARKKDAVEFSNSVEADLARAQWSDPALAQTPTSDYIARYMATMVHLKPSTHLKVQGHLRNYIEPAFGHYPIGAITPPEVRRWVSALVDHGLSAATVRAVYSTFSRVMRHAVIDSVITRNPCVGISLPRDAGGQEMRFLSPDEINRLALAHRPRFRTLIYTAAYTGMRWGELVALRTDNLDLPRATVNVVEAVAEVNGTLYRGSTKTGARRTLSLPAFLVEMLTEHVAQFASSDGDVFASTEGGPLRRNFYHRHFKPAVRTAGLDDGLRFHDLRHTCAALLIAQGAHPKEIQERMGHSTIRLTFDRYGHLLPSLDERLKTGLDEAFRAAANSASPA